MGKRKSSRSKVTSLLLAALLVGCASSVAVGPGGISTLADRPDPNSDPTYGTSELIASGRVLLRGEAGGNIDARSFFGANCPGYVARAPDFILNISIAMEDVEFAADALASVAILIKPPNSDWICASNTGSERALVNISIAESGRYAIWLGTDTRGKYEDAVLEIEAR